MPATQTIFVEGNLERDSNIYNSTCDLDLLPTKCVLKSILINYVYYLISCKGYEGIDLFVEDRKHLVETRLTDMITRRLLDRSVEFEEKFKPRFENRNALLIKTPEHALLDFQETLNSIWADGLANWGRLLGYITFVATYCGNCLEAGMILIIETLVQQAINDLDIRVGQWILMNGGWRSFLHALNEMKFS